MHRTRRRAGFTLVELLVVIGIIAVLVAILLPVLTGARSSANRVKCLSNQRQLAQALYMYANDFKGRLPSLPSQVNASLSWYAFYKPWQNLSTTDQGWLGLGMLFRRNYLKDSRCFYCPSLQGHRMNISGNQQWAVSYPDAWDDPNYKRIGYIYRVFNQIIPPYVTTAELAKLNSLRLGKGKTRLALSADIFYAFPHQPKPWGMNVAWSDGSATFVQLSKYDYDICLKWYFLSTNAAWFDRYTYFFWRALETGDFKDFSKMVDEQNWQGLRDKYPALL